MCIRDSFLSDADAKRVMSGDLKMEAYDEDPTLLNPPARQINDWRKALDSGQDWKWASAAMGDGAAVNTYEGSRAMQRILFETSAKALSLSSSTDYNDYIKNMAAGNVDAMYVKEGDKKTQLPKDVFSDYMFNTILKDHIQTLYKTQRIAAREAHFDHLYQNDRGRALNNSENSPILLKSHLSESILYVLIQTCFLMLCHAIYPGHFHKTITVGL